MFYLRPKKPGIKINFGLRREMTIPYFNILEIDEVNRKARVTSMTGRTMLYFNIGILDVSIEFIKKTLSRKDFIVSDESKYIDI